MNASTAHNGMTEAFEVTSSAICFGWAHNVAHGASQPIQKPAPLTTGIGGTVLVTQGLSYNFAAENGKWRVYCIKTQGSGEITAFICCHESVSQPVDEIRRITRLAGSPYEGDSGSHKNTATTFENQILVINRYDWGAYDNRFADQVPMSLTLSEDLHGACSMMVDYGAASQVVRDVDLSSIEREVVLLAKDGANVGARLFLHNHEYEFGRFGLNQDRSAVVSYLFFSADTEFAKSTLDGVLLHVVRTFEERVVQDNLQCENFEIFHTYRTERVGEEFVDVPMYVRPPQAELKRFADDLSLITTAEANERLAALGGYGGAHLNPTIGAPFERQVTRLLNACLMTCLSGIAAKLNSFPLTDARLQQVAQIEYGADSSSQLKKLIGRRLRGEAQPELPLCSTITDQVGAFLEHEGVQASAGMVSLIASAMDLLLDKVVELVSIMARDNNRALVTPGDVRLVILHDPELFELVRCCELLWPPVERLPVI